MRSAIIGILALALALSSGIGSARPKKTLTASDRQNARFDDLIVGHTREVMRSLQYLHPFSTLDPLEPSVYVTIAEDRILVWDETVMTLAPGGQIPQGELASCPPECLPKLQVKAARAIIRETERIRRARSQDRPQVLMIVDDRVPYRTFLAAAYSIANATAGTPPDMRLAVRPQSGPKIGQVGFLLKPPHVLKLAENAIPAMLHVSLEGQRFVVSARKPWLAQAEVHGLQGVMRVIGELKAQYANRTVIFITAASALPFGTVLGFVEPIRALYPNVTFGGVPAITGPVE